MTGWRLGLAALALLAAAAGAWWLRAAGDAAPQGSAAERDAGVASPGLASEPAPGGASPTTTGLPPLPRALRGTTPAGRLEVDAEGRFVPGAGAVALFDHFLAGTTDEPLATALRRIQAQIDALPASARGDARATLERYLAYRGALGDLDDPRLGVDLDRRLQWLRELRREHFGEDAEALFGEQEQMARIRLEMRRVSDDPELDEAERAARLAELEAQLPERVRRARAEASEVLRLMERERQLRAAGASPGEIQALREQVVGSEAAERLAAQDRERAAWSERLDRYRAERDALLADASLDAAGREAALEELRGRHFAPDEQLRVRALDAAVPR